MSDSAPGCGCGHQGSATTIDCFLADAGAACNTAGANYDQTGTCQVSAADSGDGDGGDAGTTLTCVASPMKGSMVSQDRLSFVAPLLLALLVPLLLRKRKRA